MFDANENDPKNKTSIPRFSSNPRSDARQKRNQCRRYLFFLPLIFPFDFSFCSFVLLFFSLEMIRRLWILLFVLCLRTENTIRERQTEFIFVWAEICTKLRRLILLISLRQRVSDFREGLSFDKKKTQKEDEKRNR